MLAVKNVSPKPAIRNVQISSTGRKPPKRFGDVVVEQKKLVLGFLAAGAFILGFFFNELHKS